jgi:hypothetical protein
MSEKLISELLILPEQVRKGNLPSSMLRVVLPLVPPLPRGNEGTRSKSRSLPANPCFPENRPDADSHLRIRVAEIQSLKHTQ